MSDRSRSGSDSEPEEDYEVEEIRDKRRGEDGEWLYYVKWVGWESDTNTWEPVEHLDECKEKLEEFERRWRRRQEKKEQRRREERERKFKERRERELKAAARLKVDSDDDDNGYAVERKKEKEKKRIVTDSSSDSDSEKKKKDKDKDRDGEREKSKKHKKDKDRKREDRDDKHSSKKKEEAPKKESKPKYFRDIKPEKILGVTSDLGEVHFYIKWEGNKIEPGLVTAKEAYQKIPQMCLKFYESHLVWDKKEVKKVEKAEKESSKEKSQEKTVDSVSEIVKRRESVDSKGSDSVKGEVKDKERPSSSLSKPDTSQGNQVQVSND